MTSRLGPRPDLAAVLERVEGLVRHGYSPLGAAREAVADEHGFVSWAALEAEVRRRVILERRDLAALADLLAQDAWWATAS